MCIRDSGGYSFGAALSTYTKKGNKWVFGGEYLLKNNPYKDTKKMCIRDSYKEVWIGLGGTQSAVYATEVSAEEYLAYTTEETEKVEVYRLAEKLGDDIEAAIRQLAERRRNKE